MHEVVDGEWKPTPPWLVKWLGWKPYRQFHGVSPDGGEPLGWYTYADEIPAQKAASEAIGRA
jgi:hypothetical protein